MHIQVRHVTLAKYGLTVLTVSRALPDVISTPDLLGPLLGHGDSFVLIQNGVGVERELRCKLPTTTIISGCCWIVSTVVEKGRLLKQRGPVGVLFSTQFTTVDRPAGTNLSGGPPPS